MGKFFVIVLSASLFRRKMSQLLVKFSVPEPSSVYSSINS